MSLYWSRKGAIACERHAPLDEPQRLHAEGWKPLEKRVRIEYQCQYCNGNPIKHRYQARKTLEGHRPLVLSVDDRGSTLYLRHRALQDYGFDVADAMNGQVAIDLARQLRPALILLDVHLPDMDGLRVCAELKSNPRDCHDPGGLHFRSTRSRRSRRDRLGWRLLRRRTD